MWLGNGMTNPLKYRARLYSDREELIWSHTNMVWISDWPAYKYMANLKPEFDTAEEAQKHGKMYERQGVKSRVITNREGLYL